MPQLGERSIEILATCSADLRRIAMEAIKIVDFSVVEGHRGEVAQNIAVESGKSKARWPTSKHNRTPSWAMDIQPWPQNWPAWNRGEDLERWYFLLGVIWATAKALGIRIRLGADFNGDMDFSNDALRDLPHVELVEGGPGLTIVKT